MTVQGIIQRFRRFALRRRGVQVDASAKIGPAISVGEFPRRHAAGAIVVAAHCELGIGVELNPWAGHIRLGRGVFVGPYTVIYGHGGVEIGEQTLIAMHCAIISSNHATPPRDRPIRFEPDILMPVRIGRDVWLGAGVKVLGGVTIGDGCVVGAGAVVTSDLPPFAIAIGVPARVLRYRG